MLNQIRLTKKTRAALAHLRNFGSQQEGLSRFDTQFSNMVASGHVKRTAGNQHGERFYLLTTEGDNFAYSIRND